MKTLLATATLLALTLAPAAACDYHKSASADHMSTASIQAPMSTSEDAVSGTGSDAAMTGDAADDTVRAPKDE